MRGDGSVLGPGKYFDEIEFSATAVAQDHTDQRSEIVKKQYGRKHWQNEERKRKYKPFRKKFSCHFIPLEI
jgi:hypothetical protein